MIPPALRRLNDTLWELPPAYKKGMRVSARIYATEKLLAAMDDAVFEQAANVAMLPGIVGHSFCMPAGHSGYGFPIGGVAAFDAEEGVISPGGIGFDINCGMRLVATPLTWEQVGPRLEELVDRLFSRIPAGVGRKGSLRLTASELRDLSERGMRWCLDSGYALPEDLERTEEGGCLEGAEAGAVSDKAVQRGLEQVGTLGSGNHYLKIQVARPENLFDPQAAAAVGIRLPHQVLLMVHCGSRGFGHQVASDYLSSFLRVMEPRHHIQVPDRELACAPFQSPEGQSYFKAMKCAVNVSFANRQMILHAIRQVFGELFGLEAPALRQVYDVTHNTAKVETHEVDGRRRRLLMHRKGATRALAPGMEGVPAEYQGVGQPVIIGGSMETGSYLLAGVDSGRESFYSTAHGSGRTMGRNEARRQFRGKDIETRLRGRGIYIRTASYAGLAEEAGAAYKDIDEVARATEAAGLSRRVALLQPVGNIKG